MPCGRLGAALWPGCSIRPCWPTPGRSALSAAEVEAWGWLPPALVHEGAKVRPEWLFRFLLDPTPIRPAAVLRMPRFNLSQSEAAKLTDYFAAVADAEYPYTPKPVAASAPLDAARLDTRDEAWCSDRTTYCGKCHMIGDRRRPGENRTVLAPRLDEVGKRLRPEYLRRWLADPKSVLPYTAMPAHFSVLGQAAGARHFSRQQPGATRRRGRVAATI